jgi:hypothetical protein
MILAYKNNISDLSLLRFLGEPLLLVSKLKEVEATFDLNRPLLLL